MASPHTTATEGAELTPAEERAELLQRYAAGVLARLREAPRYASLGRQQYVYVEDVKQALELELRRVEA